MMRIAYLNTRYPSLSHTFIEREIRALRDLGAEIHTFSIRKPTAEGTLSDRHKHAAQDTYYLFNSAPGLLLAVPLAFLNPIALARTLIKSQRIAPPGFKSRLRHIMYAFEAAKLGRELRRRKLNHIHVHMANNGAAVALLATIFATSVKYSLSIHGSAEFFHIDSWALKPKAENAAFVRCISNFCRAQVMTWTDPAAWPRYHIVHCGIDVAEFLPRIPKKNPAFCILTIGRIESIKGYPVLLQACKQLSDAGINWHLDMVGSGPLTPYLKTLANTLNITPNISFTGAVGQDQIQHHIDRADVMVISSFMEGIPVVLMEAMAKELPVIATKVGGIHELIDDQTDGLLVTTASPDALANALKRMSRDPDFCLSLAMAGRRKIVSQFALEQTGNGMFALFQQYCGSVVALSPNYQPSTPATQSARERIDQPYTMLK